MSEQVFVERRFDNQGQAVVCRFFRPTLNPTGEFRCQWSIDWGDREKKSHSHGIDGIQALLLAMRIVHTELVISEPYKTGQLTYLDEGDLDLPPHYANEED